MKLQAHSRPEPIVICGGGFAGVAVAQRLERSLPPNHEIVVISDTNHLVFTPMLPEVVGRTISPLHIVVPGRQLTRRTRWLEARISRIDSKQSEVHYVLRNGAEASLRYAHLVVACGSVVNLHEIPGLATHGYPLKTVTDALAMGNDVIGNFEAAATEPKAEERRRLLTAVVIGGGFSGVEIAGHLADLMRGIHHFYPELRKDRPRIILLHEGDRLLPELETETLSGFALKKLRQNKIDVRLKTGAKKVTSTSVHLYPAEEIAAAMVVCTVGTDTSPLIKGLGLGLEKGRLKTDPDMRVAGCGNLWAIGDCAFIPNAETGRPCPPTAQFALQQARKVAGNLERALTGIPTVPFAYRPRGMLASIGHRNAVAKIYGLHLSGFVAWFLWRGVYLSKLPTLARKLEVSVGWAWSLLFPANLVQFRLERTGEERK